MHPASGWFAMIPLSCEMPNMGKLHKFFKAIWSDWLARMSGPLTVPFTLAAFVLPSNAARISFSALAVVAGLVTCYRVWATADDKAQQAESRLMEIESAKPALKLNTPDPVYVEQVYQCFTEASGEVLHEQVVPFLKIRFVNDPDLPYPSANADGVRAYVDYYRLSDNHHVLHLDGRWAESTQPSAFAPQVSKAPLLAATFGIGEAKSVDVAYYDARTAKYYAWNNDNYNYGYWTCPTHLLDGDRFRIDVRLRGDWIDKRFSFVFRTENKSFVIEELLA